MPSMARKGRRISLYLLDSNVEQNAEIDRLDNGASLRRKHRNADVQEKSSRHGGIRLLTNVGTRHPSTP